MGVITSQKGEDSAHVPSAQSLVTRTESATEAGLSLRAALHAAPQEATLQHLCILPPACLQDSTLGKCMKDVFVSRSDPPMVGAGKGDSVGNSRQGGGTKGVTKQRSMHKAGDLGVGSQEPVKGLSVHQRVQVHGITGPDPARCTLLKHPHWVLKSHNCVSSTHPRKG